MKRNKLSYPELREKILKDLSKHLSESRFKHTLGVEETAVKMAEHFGVPIEGASLAALLHDNAKYKDIDDQLKLCRVYPVEMELTKAYSSVLHAFAGAVRAKNKFEGLSQDVIEAIRWHCTGRPEMSDLEKIIYIADYIEPNRKKFEGLSQARELAMKDLDACMYLILQQTLDYVKEKKHAIYPMTYLAYEYYQTKE